MCNHPLLAQNPSLQLQVPLPVPAAAGTVTTRFRQCLKPLPATSGPVAVPPMLEARPQKAATHCVYSVPMLEAMPQKAGRHCFDNVSNCWLARFSRPKCLKSARPASGSISIAVPPMREAVPTAFQKLPNIVSTAFGNFWLARFSKPKCLKLIKPLPAASGTMHCHASNAGSKASKNCQRLHPARLSGHT